MLRGKPNKRYTPEFKKLVVETMMKEKLGYRETARRFEVRGAQQIINWERIYQKARRHWPSNAAAAAAVADQGSCRKRAKKICWQKFFDCVRRMNT